MNLRRNALAVLPALCLALVTPASAGQDGAWPYGVTALPEETAEEAAADSAAGEVNLLRQELAAAGNLSEASRLSARNLRFFASARLSERDLAFLSAVTSKKLGGIKVEGLGVAAELPSAQYLGPEEFAALSRDDFKAWLAALRSEAASLGIPAAVLQDALTGLTTQQSVLDLENTQPEHTITFEAYIDKVVASRVERGRQMFVENRVQLEAISARYKVPGQVITALWGIETKYGQYMGEFVIVRALATLAYAGKRPAFFRKELMEALRILAEEGMKSRDLKGSWAGAMGQCQFMPSSYRRLAADGDGDGKRDIWKNRMDVFASAANYLSKAGWRMADTWGQEVRLPENFDQSLADLKVVKTVLAWKGYNVAALDGSLPDDRLEASIIRPSGPGGRSFMVLANWRVFYSWNRSSYFCTAAGILSDRISQAGR
ncbi:MAG: lytic murein transglycosylase [Elusimicrobia bacterium]|nr:lytic murein transglycosylase [Elusimicrobiota bacterium]